MSLYTTFFIPSFFEICNINISIYQHIKKKKWIDKTRNLLTKKARRLECILLNLVQQKKMDLDKFTDEDIEKILNIKLEVDRIAKNYEQFKSYNDKNSPSSYVKYLENEIKTLVASNLNKDKEIASKDNTIASKDKIIASKDSIISKLTTEKVKLENKLYNTQLTKQSLISYIEKLKGNIALYNTRRDEKSKAIEMQLLEQREAEQRKNQKTLDSLNKIVNAKDDSLKNFGKNLPATTPLKITYRNQQGNFVELLGSTNKKSNKNIKEILVNFKLNTAKYGGDIAVYFYLSCIGGNSRNCQKRDIIYKPITLLSNNMWAECDQRFTIPEGLSRDCTYKIKILHGTTSLFSDYIFTTD